MRLNATGGVFSELTAMLGAEADAALLQVLLQLCQHLDTEKKVELIYHFQT